MSGGQRFALPALLAAILAADFVPVASAHPAGPRSCGGGGRALKAVQFGDGGAMTLPVRLACGAGKSTAASPIRYQVLRNSY
jgi:hypothetical protein